MRKEALSTPLELKSFETQGSFAEVREVESAQVSRNEWEFLGNQSAITKIIFGQIDERQLIESNSGNQKEQDTYRAAVNWLQEMLASTLQFQSIRELNAKLKELDYSGKAAANEGIKDYCASTYRLRRTPSTDSQMIDPMDYVISDGLRTAGDFYSQEIARLGLISKGAILQLNRDIMENPQVNLEAKDTARLKTEQFCTHIERLVATLERQNEVKNAATFLELIQIFADDTRNPKARYEAWAHLIAAHRSILQECNAVEKNGIMGKITDALVKGEFFNYDQYFDEIHGRSVYSLHDRETGRCVEVAFEEGRLVSDKNHVVQIHEMPPRFVGVDTLKDRAAYTGDPKRKISALAKDSIKNGRTIDDTHRMRINAENPRAAIRIARELYTALKKGGLPGYIDTDSGVTQTLAPEGIDFNTRFGHFKIPYTPNGHNQNSSTDREVIQFDYVLNGRRVEMQIYTIQTFLNSEYDKNQFHEGYYISKIFNGGDCSTIMRMFPDLYIQYTQLQQLRRPVDEITSTLNNPEYAELMKTAAHSDKFNGGKYKRAMYLSEYAARAVFGDRATRLLQKLDGFLRRIN